MPITTKITSTSATKSFGTQTASKASETFSIDASEIPITLASLPASKNVQDALEAVGGAKGVAVQASAPSSPVEGDLWFDTSNNVLKVYNGSAWVAVTSATAGITDVVDDTSPQLGGNLDLQTYTLSTAPLAAGGLFSNPDTVSTNTTITTSTTYNQVLFGPIAVTGTAVLTIAGSDQLNIM